MRGFILGGLVLIALGRVLPDDNATRRVGRLLNVPAALARRFLDPNVPAIGAARRKRLGLTETDAPPLDAAQDTAADTTPRQVSPLRPTSLVPFNPPTPLLPGLHS